MKLSLRNLGLAAVIASASLLPATKAFAQAEQMLVDLFLKDADLTAATRMVTEKTGLQFVIKPGAEPFGRITMRLEKADPSDAIRYICQASGAYCMRDESGVFIISRTPFEPKKTTETGAPVEKPKILVRKIKVQKAGVQDVYDALVTGTPASSTRPFEDLKKFQAVAGPRARTYADQAIKVLGNNIASTQSKPYDSENYTAPLTGSESGNDVRLPGESANQGFGGGFGGGQGGLGGGGGIGGGLGQGGGGLGGGGGIGGQGGGASLIGGQGLVPTGIDFVSYDPTDNSLVVRGTEEDINTLQQRIALFDVAPKQVIIKVEFITVTNNLNKSLGFDWLFERGTVFAGNRPGSFVRTSDPIFLNYATGNLTTRMRTLLSEGYGKTVQSPILRTMNNQPATLTSTQQTTVFVNTTTVNNNQTIVTSNPQPLSITTFLAITPRINDDGYITVFLSPQISDFGQKVRGPDGQEIPDQISQSISVVARVKNNETIVLGGFTRKSETGSQSRFPILGDLPIIGQFFRSTTTEKQNSELLIFVTPSVVEEDEGGLP